MPADPIRPLLLSEVERLGFSGDVHGNWGHLLAVMDLMFDQRVSVLIVAGDFGFVRSKLDRRNSDLTRMGVAAQQRGITILFVDGNHEDFDAIEEYPVAEDGVRWIGRRVGHLPRGFHARLASGRSFAAFGGANSIDRWLRTPHVSWWPQESITDNDLAALGRDHVDLLVGHDAPLNVPELDEMLGASARFWPAEGLAYSREGRVRFDAGFRQVTPDLYIGGHYHHQVDQQVTYGSGGRTWQSRVIVLDCEGSGYPDNCCIVNVDTLEVSYPWPPKGGVFA